LEERNLFDRWANDYDDFIRKRHEESYKEVEYLLEKLDWRRNVLDIGAGTGRITNYIIKLGADVTALDFSTKMLHKNPSKQKICADAHFLPFHENTFDITFAENTLRYIQKWRKVIEEMVRVAKESVVIVETKPPKAEKIELPNRIRKIASLITRIAVKEITNELPDSQIIQTKLVDIVIASKVP
jgi:ubiquinone/menaquinone biosynthesis C-methylase UbiE